MACGTVVPLQPFARRETTSTKVTLVNCGESYDQQVIGFHVCLQIEPIKKIYPTMLLGFRDRCSAKTGVRRDFEGMLIRKIRHESSGQGNRLTV